MALNTHEIREEMKDDPQFVGVFASNRLPSGVDRQATIKMIVNFDPASWPGSHWIAIYRRHGRAYYFDSFGNLPPTSIHDWLVANSDSYRHYPRAIQSRDDKVSCGYICIAFLQRL